MQCYASSDEKGLESVAGKTGQNIKWQSRSLGLATKLLCRHISGISF
jgi:hypothetical protein